MTSSVNGLSGVAVGEAEAEAEDEAEVVKVAETVERKSKS
jgi:hypothetical protein